ncbi:MAG: cell wall hydrolase [Pseudomonadota bacterium]
MKFVKAFAVVAALFAPAVQAAESDDRDNYFKEDAASAREPQSIWNSFFRVRPKPKPKIVEVSYSRNWLDAQPKAVGDEQWRCLSEALYFEARGETVKGQFAVAEVIMNRVKSTRFPSTLCGVINQGTGKKYQCQFTYTCDGYKEVIAEPKAFERVSKVARAIIDGAPMQLTGGATHYHTKHVRPAWSRVYKRTAAIGVHLFYRHNYRTASSN